MCGRPRNILMMKMTSCRGTTMPVQHVVIVYWPEPTTSQPLKRFKNPMDEQMIVCRKLLSNKIHKQYISNTSHWSSPVPFLRIIFFYNEHNKRIYFRLTLHLHCRRSLLKIRLMSLSSQTIWEASNKITKQKCSWINIQHHIVTEISAITKVTVV